MLRRHLIALEETDSEAATLLGKHFQAQLLDICNDNIRADIVPGDRQTPNVFHEHTDNKDMLTRDSMFNIIRTNDAPGNTDGSTRTI